MKKKYADGYVHPMKGRKHKEESKRNMSINTSGEKHPFYGKTVRSSSKVLAHDENNDCQLGDTVQITESRPLSRHQRWRVQKILVKAD